MRTKKQKEAAKNKKGRYKDRKNRFNPSRDDVNKAIKEYIKKGGKIEIINVMPPLNIDKGEVDTTSFFNSGPSTRSTNTILNPRILTSREVTAFYGY